MRALSLAHSTVCCCTHVPQLLVTSACTLQTPCTSGGLFRVLPPVDQYGQRYPATSQQAPGCERAPGEERAISVACTGVVVESRGRMRSRASPALRRLAANTGICTPKLMFRHAGGMLKAEYPNQQLTDRGGGRVRAPRATRRKCPSRHGGRPHPWTRPAPLVSQPMPARRPPAAERCRPLSGDRESG